MMDDGQRQTLKKCNQRIDQRLVFATFALKLVHFHVSCLLFHVFDYVASN